MIAVIDYGSGNTASVVNALSEFNIKVIVTNDENEILKSEKIIFPGVGEASFAMEKLNKFNLINVLRIVKQPLLGICLGMQLLSKFSDEGNTSCLGLIPSVVKQFDKSIVKVPHMGWNNVKIMKQSKLFKGIDDYEYFYFANSFFLPLNEFSVAASEHDIVFTAAIEKENIFGVQFHPEKSGEAGMKLLQNFIDL